MLVEIHVHRTHTVYMCACVYIVRVYARMYVCKTAQLYHCTTRPVKRVGIRARLTQRCDDETTYRWKTCKNTYPGVRVTRNIYVLHFILHGFANEIRWRTAVSLVPYWVRADLHTAFMYRCSIIQRPIPSTPWPIVPWAVLVSKAVVQEFEGPLFVAPRFGAHQADPRGQSRASQAPELIVYIC